MEGRRILMIRLSYCVPSLTLYVFVLVALIKERRSVAFSAKYFYSLLIAQAIFNISTFMNFFYINLAGSISIKSWLSVLYINVPTFIITVASTITFHAVFVQTYMTFFVSLHRMTLITHPTAHWKYLLSASILITLLTPLISTYKLIIGECYFAVNTATESLVLTLDRNVVQVVMKELKAERNMLILAILDFFVESVVFGLYAVMFYNLTSFALLSILIPHSLDILIFSNAYLLMILNKRIRHRVFGFMNCSGTLQNNVAAQSSTACNFRGVHITHY
ncbi:unnamed protein product [Cylicocyclus nassatus]|uniref:Serpentine receptor class gamma n=1 Tax=Cylicocyclus nassatus TaxID=53992 RepID=A0AA36HC51_CYLNA|nr:unnamed protein product [Cylicocyclus nassatus]